MHLFREYEDWAAENSEVIRTEVGSLVGEYFVRSFGFVTSWRMIVNIGRMRERERPKFWSDGSWPHAHGMEEHRPSFGGQKADVAFDAAVLPMGADAAEGVLLGWPVSFAAFDKSS